MRMSVQQGELSEHADSAEHTELAEGMEGAELADRLPGNRERCGKLARAGRNPGGVEKLTCPDGSREGCRRLTVLAAPPPPPQPAWPAVCSTFHKLLYPRGPWWCG